MQDYTAVPSVDNAIAMQKFGVGQPIRRKEDDTLVRGKGKYTDDFNLPGQLHAWVVRSSHAHGVIRNIDTSTAKGMPGVRGIWTGQDLAAANYGPFTCGLPLKNRDGSPLLQTNRTALMTDKVRYVGDPVAFVVADTVAQARDAAEAVAVDINALPAVTECEAATLPGAPLLLGSYPQQRRTGFPLWRHRCGRGRLRQRGPCDHPRHRQHPRRRGVDGAALCIGLVRQVQ